MPIPIRRYRLSPKRPLLAALLTSAALTSVVVAAPQRNEARRPSRTFGEQIEVRVVNLEAVVVDRDGNRVHGLGPEDFLLSVDGKEVEIQYFSEVAEGAAVALPAGDAKPLATPAGVTPGSVVGTSFLLFIDDAFITQAAQRNRILEEIELGLSRFGPEDQMAIVAYDGQRIEMISNWSRSPVALSQALESARQLRSTGFVAGQLQRDVDRGRTTEALLTDVGSDSSGGGAQVSADATRMVREDGLPVDVCHSIHRLERQLDRVVHGAAATLRSFGNPSGRKVMLLLSGGWPHSTRDFVAGVMDPTAARDCSVRGPKLYAPVFETANQLGYTLYPIDVLPPARAEIHAADRGAALDLALGSGNDAAPVGGERQFVRQQELESTLLKLADETGGQALLAASSLHAMDRVMEDVRSYYWLGFTPSWKGDDEPHNVRLKVARPGLEVRSRNGFRDFSRTAEVDFVTESALLVGALPGAAELGLRLGPLPGKGRGKLNVPLELTIPLDAIVMQPTGGRFRAELELRIAALDEDGNRNDLEALPVVLEGDDLPPPGAHAVYEITIRLRRGPHEIVVTLYDPISDMILAATGKVAL